MARLPGRLLPCLLFAWLISAGRGESASAFALRAWETDDGLAHNGVNTIVQAADGFLWLATQNGAMSFDGVAFRKVRSPLIADAKTSAIRALIELAPGTFLMAHDDSGLLQLRGYEVTLHPLTARMEKPRRIARLFRESDAVFWILFAHREIWRCSGDSVEIFSPALDAPSLGPVGFARDGGGSIYVSRGAGMERYADRALSQVPGASPKACVICSSRDGGVWSASADGVSYHRDGNWKRVIVGENWSGEWVPLALMEDRSGALWIGTKEHGVLRWADGRLEGIQSSYPRINDLLEDAEGNIWVATAGGGMNRLQRPRFSLLAEEDGVLPNNVGSVCEDKAGNLWFANRICFGRLIDNRLQAPEFAEPLARKVVPICPDHEGNLWMGTAEGLLRRGPEDGAPIERVEAGETTSIHVIFCARDGSIWAGGETGSLLHFQDRRWNRYGPAEGYTGDRAQTIAERANGEIWVGTDDGDLFRWSKGKFVKQSAGLPSSGIRALLGDAEGRMWIATGGRGLYVWQGGKFRSVSEVNGLPDDTVSQLIEDDIGNLWIGTSRCIFQARKEDLLACMEGRSPVISPTVFGKDDGVAGFSSAANFQPSVWKTRTGQLYFATRKGLIVTTPSAWTSPPGASRARIESISADGLSRTLSERSFPAAAKNLEFRYTVPAFSAPERVQFRYRLDGFDADWNPAGTQRSVTYPQLPPGRYVFRVAASHEGGAWSDEEAVFSFEVVPAWWQTWPARSLAILSGAAALALAVRYWSLRRLKARLEVLEERRRLDMERSRIARDLHDSLGASLTQAGMLAEELCEDCDDVNAMKEQSQELAVRVHAIARDLDAAVWAVSPKNDSLASLAAYLGQFAIEYFRASPVRCRVFVADDIPAAPLAPETRHHLFLTAREAMNNILKHAQAREVRLTLRMAGSAFELQIEDDGCGFDPAISVGRNGLQNMKTRVADIGGLMEVRSSPGETSIRITLPAEHWRFPATLSESTR